MPEEIKSVKVVTFDGEDEEFRQWKSKMTMIAKVNGWYGRLVNETEDVLLIKMDTTDDNEKEILKNERTAQMYLTLACGKTAFNYVENAETAWKMFANLKERYEPEEEDDYITLSKQFMNCKLKNDEDDPEIWFHEIEYLCNRMRSINPA